MLPLKTELLLQEVMKLACFTESRPCFPCFPQAWANPSSSLEVEMMYVEDRPAFSYRGMHLDIAQEFH